MVAELVLLLVCLGDCAVLVEPWVLVSGVRIGHGSPWSLARGFRAIRWRRELVVDGTGRRDGGHFVWMHITRGIQARLVAFRRRCVVGVSHGRIPLFRRYMVMYPQCIRSPELENRGLVVQSHQRVNHLVMIRMEELKAWLSNNVNERGYVAVSGIPKLLR